MLIIFAKSSVVIQNNFIGVAEAMVSMGATKSNVDVVRFAKDLQEVIEDIQTIQPQINVSSHGKYLSIPC